MSKQEQLAAKIKAVAVFCLEHQGRCFEGWNGKKVFAYLSFHALSGTLFVVSQGGAATPPYQIRGVAIGWTGAAAEFLRREKNDEPQFAWRLPKEGNALMIANVFGSREVCDELWTMALNRWPHVSRVFAYRRKAGKPESQGQLKEFTLRELGRFHGEKVRAARSDRPTNLKEAYEYA